MAERPAVEIARRAPLGIIALRCDLGDPRLAPALDGAAGCALPAQRRFVGGAGGAAAWMSPDELLVFVPPATLASALATLETALAGAHCLIADVSDARAVFRLTGPGAREALAKGAPVDLAPAAFGLGDFRRTRLGQVAAAIWSPEAEVFELMCFRSFAEHVALWLETAALPGSLPGFLAAADPGGGAPRP